MSHACLFCGSTRQRLVLSLGQQPLANSYLTAAQLTRPEPVYPLDLYWCEECHLTQITPVATSQDIFSDYAYFSSFSTTWLEHARQYVAMISERLQLGAASQVIEIASNDGYLLQYFVERGIPCLGIEPAVNVAAAAREKRVPTRVAFWGQETAASLNEERMQADLIIGNNVLAHVPTLNEFVAGVKLALKPDGVATFEFPHLYRLIEEHQFDTIYHEHFSYFAFFVVERVFAQHGLRLFDVEQLSTHGGSLRIYACHGDAKREDTPRTRALREEELAAGLDAFAYYESFAGRVENTRQEVLDFLLDAREHGQKVAGYGAPAKGNTLLNYCGVTPALLPYTVDRSPHKQGLYLPGSHVPVRAPEHVAEDRPDYLFILPWNLQEEIMDQMRHIRDWGGRFVVAIPHV
ncbi:MAG: methyltransferase domain-containing protein, partial [Candidatus Hydrogenedentes bacterium]|nr:methyltransferase domain-containing protein [Candidatus Hydrogenedentota bacterium]